MKKLIPSVIAILFLLFIAVPAMSETAQANPTDRRDLIEYVELYMKRITEYQMNNKVDFRINPTLNMPPCEENGFLVFESSGGSAYVSPDDYKVSEVWITLTTSKTDKSASEKEVINAASCIAALEYDGIKESIMNITGVGPEEAGYNIVKHMISPIMKTAAQQSFASGEKIKVYSGNYDYYIRCAEYEKENITIVFLIAEARE